MQKAVVKPTDSNDDAAKSTNQVSGGRSTKIRRITNLADPMPKLKESEETEKDSEDKETVKEGEMRSLKKCFRRFEKTSRQERRRLRF